MSSDEEREKTAAQLRSLSLPELVDVLRRVLPAHDDRKGRNGMTHALVLAVATRFDKTVPLPAGESTTGLDVVAWPARDHYDGGFGPETDLTESGSCPSCGCDVISTAKQAFCPLCGAQCWLT